MSGRVNEKFWSGKRVFITGHTGFKGGWLSLWLQSLGSVIHGASLEPLTNPSFFEESHIIENMEHSILDIRDFTKLNLAIQNFQPEIIIHMAAQPLVRVSYSKPIETYETNVMGTVNVLEAARHCKNLKVILNITTDKCYENQEWLWGYRENDRIGGIDPYSSSKSCAELVSTAFRESFLKQTGISIATARAGNVIGGGDWALDRLIPDILSALEKGDPILLRNPDAIRPWQHVLEPLRGYLLLAENLYLNGQDYAEAWNFGPLDKDSRSVKWIANYFCEKWGNKTKWLPQPGFHPHETNFLKLDISKVQRHLNWFPKWNLETALNQIIEWHKAWLKDEDMRSFSLKQIKQYNKDLF